MSELEKTLVSLDAAIEKIESINEQLRHKQKMMKTVHAILEEEKQSWK